MPRTPITRQQSWVLSSIVFAGFLYQLDACVVNISLPTLARHFGVDTGEISFVALSYLLVVSSTLPLFGKLADRAGIRTVFLLGYVLFLAGTLLCGLAPSLAVLLGARCVQGLGGAMLLTTAFAGIPRFMPPEVTGFSFGILNTASGVGLTLGAPLGGFLSGLLSWRWIFLAQVPFALAALAIGWKVLPRGAREVPGERRPFDLPGALLSILCLFPALLALAKGQEAGWVSPGILGSFGLSLAALGGLVLWERRCADPLVALALLRNDAFVFPLLGRVLGSLVSGGTLFLLPFYLELTRGLRAEQSSLVLMLYSMILMGVAPLAGHASDRGSPRTISASALFVTAGACLLFCATLHRPGLVPVLLFVCCVAPAFGFFYPSNNLLITRAIPTELLGSASAVLATAWTLGVSLGVSLFETAFDLRLGLSGLPPHASGPQPPPLPGLFPGFRTAFALGVLVAFGALFFCLRPARRPPTSPPPASPAG